MNCKNCNKEIDVNNIYGSGIFCNKKCQLSYAYEKNKKDIAKFNSINKTYEIVHVEKVCEKCNKPFIIERKIDKNNNIVINKNEIRFCSRKCSNSRIQTEEMKEKKRIKLTKIRDKKICKFCGTEFIPNTNKQSVCSVGCTSGLNLHKANLTYRKDEIPIKERMEFLLNQTFKKEEINGFYIDFSSNNYLIEYTKDNTHGVSDAIKRFSTITDDRIKIIISNLNGIGTLRKEKVKNVVFIDLKDFDEKDNVFTLYGVIR